MSKDDMKLALEVMRNNGDVSVDEWIATEKAIQEALAQPEQEPVAWLTDRDTMYFDKEDAQRDCDGFIFPLFKEKNT